MSPKVTWQAGTANKTKDTDNQWRINFTPSPAKVSMTLESYPDELEWWKSSPIASNGEILTTISNGGAANATVNINWNGTQTTKLTWSPSGGSSKNGGSQYLICQSTSQQSTTNGQAMLLKSVSLAPKTNTNIAYQIQQESTGSGVAYGDNITTNAFLIALEIVPTQ